MENKVLHRFIIILLSAVWSLSLWASTPVSGVLTATKSCAAYVSKNKRTNPDRIQLEIDKTYSVFEVNRVLNPNWYRIRVEDAKPQERWVEKLCGTSNVQVGDSIIPGRRGQCQTAGLEDSYKLALSWQPAFCEDHRDKPECRVTNPKTYQARNFTLHGFWPNKISCGKNYSFCGEARNKPGDFCDYPALSLVTEVRNELEQVMPSAKAGSCLQRHEWHKHGTCQTKWSIDEYHEISVDLTHQFNKSGVAYFISRNIGNKVTEADFFKKIDCAFGDNAHKRLQIKCENGNLVDIYVNLPLDIKKNENLGDMIRRAGADFRSSCNGSFRIDPIGFVN